MDLCVKVMRQGIACLVCLCLWACDGATPNNPYPTSEAKENIYYTAFSIQPGYLDPAKSYTTDQSIFVMQIYEPPLQYHYLLRPFELIPLTVTEMPKVEYIHDDNGNIIYSEYIIKIKPGILYQPHPAFAKNTEGEYLYHAMNEKEMRGIETLNDFKEAGTRELTAEDYVHEIKRLASPVINSPIYGLMSDYIVGLKELNQQLQTIYDKQTFEQKQLDYIDVRDISFKGAQVIDRYTYKVKIYGNYPQFRYWLAMPFFAPMPWEADVFYAQLPLIKKNITLDWFPIGTGPYMMTENNPNRRLVMEKNPNFRGELYPSEGTPEDVKNGLLLDAGKTMPFIDKIVFTLEKENIPRWSKFLQGYYDASGIASDNFDQAIQTGNGEAEITPKLKAQGISLLKEVQLTNFYWGFNMLDETVGGYSEQQQKLRQAISIAFDIEEFIQIFTNDRGIAAQGPLPPGVFGSGGINPYVYDTVDGKPVRKSINQAKQLMREAGYPEGIDPKTDQRLVLNLDVPSRGDPDEKARYGWMRKQFSKIGIDLNVRGTDWNRFRSKLEKGQIQIYGLGWVADYPDPENFLFLFYGSNSKALQGGVNSSNYNNPQVDNLFNLMMRMESTPERLQIIQEMIDILHRDAPWIWGYHPEDFILKQDWIYNVNINEMVRGNLKYYRVDPLLRADQRIQWNKPIYWPIALVALFLLLLILPLVVSYWYKEHHDAQKRYKDE